MSCLATKALTKGPYYVFLFFPMAMADFFWPKSLFLGCTKIASDIGVFRRGHSTKVMQIVA